MATVGFKEDVFSVRESYGAVRVCVSVTVPPVSCPVNTEFTVNIGISGGTAGNYNTCIFFSQPLCYLQSLQSLLVIMMCHHL